MDKRGNLQNVGYPVFFTPGAIAKLSFICDGEVTLKLKKTKPQSKIKPNSIVLLGFLTNFSYLVLGNFSLSISF